MIDEHSHGKLAFIVHLDLDVDQNPLFHPAFEQDLEKLIDVTPADLGIGGDLLQLLVERLIGPAPVDIGVGLGKEQPQKGLKENIKGFLPGTIVIGHQRLPYSRWNENAGHHTMRPAI